MSAQPLYVGEVGSISLWRVEYTSVSPVVSVEASKALLPDGPFSFDPAKHCVSTVSTDGKSQRLPELVGTVPLRWCSVAQLKLRADWLRAHFDALRIFGVLPDVAAESSVASLAVAESSVASLADLTTTAPASSLLTDLLSLS